MGCDEALLRGAISLAGHSFDPLINRDIVEQQPSAEISGGGGGSVGVEQAVMDNGPPDPWR